MVNRELMKTPRYNGGFDDCMVILISAFVIASITSLFFFDGVIRITHLIANRKSAKIRKIFKLR